MKLVYQTELTTKPENIYLLTYKAQNKELIFVENNWVRPRSREYLGK